MVAAVAAAVAVRALPAVQQERYELGQRQGQVGIMPQVRRVGEEAPLGRGEGGVMGLHGARPVKAREIPRALPQRRCEPGRHLPGCDCQEQGDRRERKER